MSGAVVKEFWTECQLNILTRASTFYLNKATGANSVNSPFNYHLIKMECCQFAGDVIVGIFFFSIQQII
jgi:hypothetical protein